MHIFPFPTHTAGVICLPHNIRDDFERNRLPLFFHSETPYIAAALPLALRICSRHFLKFLASCVPSHGHTLSKQAAHFSSLIFSVCKSRSIAKFKISWWKMRLIPPGGSTIGCFPKKKLCASRSVRCSFCRASASSGCCLSLWAVSINDSPCR